MKILELIIDSFDELTGVDAVALVEKPAIEAEFMAFKEVDIEESIALSLIENALKDLFVDRLPGESRDDYLGRCIPKLLDEGYKEDQAAAICYQGLSEEELDLDVSALPPYNNEIKEELSSDKFTFSLNEDQHIVVGPLMIPNKLIYRVDEQGDPYFVFFSEDTIEQIAEKVMRDNHMHKLNLEHNPEDTVDGYMVETWLVEDPLKDKQQVYGFNYPKGSWLGKYKIEDMDVWQKVKNNEINGFSIEGFFSDRFVQAQAEK